MLTTINYKLQFGDVICTYFFAPEFSRFVDFDITIIQGDFFVTHCYKQQTFDFMASELQTVLDGLGNLI